MPALTVFDLSGKIALVTGSSTGIGLALAEGLAEAGARVVLNARGTEKLAHAVEALRDKGYSADGLAFDVADPEAVATAIDQIEREIGPLTILVNNAGITRRAALDSLSNDNWRQVLAVNLDSLFYVGREAARRMIPRGYGKIVNICSVMSEIARPTTGPYVASKGGAKMLTKAMAVDWAKHGIRVNGVGPGYFATELTDGLVQDPAFSGWLEKRVPMGRWARPEELKGTIVYLASPASDFVTGAMVYVDGGLTAAM